MSVRARIISALTKEAADPINPEGEKIVTLIPRADPTETSGPAFRYGLILPGEEVGDELFISVLPINTDETVTPQIILFGQPVNTLMNGAGGFPWIIWPRPFMTPPPGPFDYLYCTAIQFPIPGSPNPVEGQPPLSSPAVIVMRWTGTYWLVMQQSPGVNLQGIF
jgi:hypothetical protein